MEVKCEQGRGEPCPKPRSPGCPVGMSGEVLEGVQAGPQERGNTGPYPRMPLFLFLKS